MLHQQTTIAALSTPPGRGAIGILRLSGLEALSIAGECFAPFDGRSIQEHPPRRMIYGTLLDVQGQAIDRSLAVYHPAPNSYTGEDMVELHCHGAPAVLSLGLEALFAKGACQAGPGEFTRRAFLSGKLDLTQAEAVGDLLEARSREGVRNAVGQLAGALSRRLDDIYSALLDVMAHFHAVLDYPDEDISPFRMDELGAILARQEQALTQLLTTASRGRQLTQGIACAIVGQPNAGKSSLLNALVGYDRAIVSEIPGTTRDTVEGLVEWGGLPFRLIDTAGLRDSDDPIEQLGALRSRQAMTQAELVLVLVDGTRPMTAEDTALLQQAQAAAATILVRTKGDLPQAPTVPQAVPTVTLSAKTGAGLDRLGAAAGELFPQETGAAYGQLLTNTRQTEAADRARQAIARARAALAAGLSPDALLTDVEEGLSALGELTGQAVREEITQRIFQRFCVGK